MTVPLKSLKRGHVIGYDQIFLPSIHRVSGQCLNYTLVGTDKRRETCFKEPPQPKRRNAVRKSIPAIRLTRVDDETLPSTKRGLLPKKKRGNEKNMDEESDIEKKLSGLGLTPRRINKNDTSVLHPTLHIAKKNQKEKTVHLQAVLSFLSNEKIRGKGS